MLIIIGSVLFILVATRFFLAKRNQALNTLRRHGRCFRLPSGTRTLQSFDECMSLIRFYGILPEKFKYESIEELHATAVASFERYIDCIDEEHRKMFPPGYNGQEETLARSQMFRRYLHDELDVLRGRISKAREVSVA